MARRMYKVIVKEENTLTMYEQRRLGGSPKQAGKAMISLLRRANWDGPDAEYVVISSELADDSEIQHHHA